MQSKLSESQLRERIATLEKAVQPPPPGVQAVASEITKANIHLLERLRIELLLIEDISKIPIERLESKKDFIKSAGNPNYNPIIARYEQEIQHRQTAPVTENQQPTTNNQPKPEATSPSIGGGRGEAGVEIKTRIIAPTAIPRDRRLDATIEADHNANPYNPRITIRWDDGYHFTGDETAIRGRFTSTLRDTIELKYSQERKFEKIWRWDTPWRCAGFYKALIHFNPENPPTLADLGFTRPGDITRIVFDLVTASALTPETKH